MATSPLLTLHYASLEDVAQDLDMVIQSSSSEEWSWQGASAHEQHVWSSFVQNPSLAASSTVAGLAGKLQVMPGVALSFSLPSSSKEQEAAVDVSAPTLPPDSVARIKESLLSRSKEWSEEGIESLYLFDLLTTAQALLSGFPDLHSNHSTASAPESNLQPAGENNGTKTSIKLSRALFWSHHLKAPSKLKDFNNWCPELGVWGVVRVGYPGYLCFEGESSAVDEMVRRVKGLQWHAIQLRVQRSSVHATDPSKKGKDGLGPMEQALLSCALAKNHPDNTHKAGEKVRTGCQVIENLGELVERLRGCGLEEEEISEALGIKLSGTQ
ncbi:uncharacterized protein UTRI_00473_B [Ustilago trichophora]|uniref:Small nuclear ribonucleoprotein Prp3 C-terminal domain-containing protein n=1 Tax=Ustilago trichophora TaxID=86804 RepID=A0A5C3DPI9_9BASI|nr:uncharacterized protein UTRI_00473_B [Ustilago trichophora]